MKRLVLNLLPNHAYSCEIPIGRSVFLEHFCLAAPYLSLHQHRRRISSIRCNLDSGGVSCDGSGPTVYQKRLWGMTANSTAAFIFRKERRCWNWKNENPTELTVSVFSTELDYSLPTQTLQWSTPALQSLNVLLLAHAQSDKLLTHVHSAKETLQLSKLLQKPTPTWRAQWLVDRGGWFTLCALLRFKHNIFGQHTRCQNV